MDAEQRATVLETINEVQNDGGHNGTAPITVQIGGVDENSQIIEHGSLYVQNAPAKLITKLSEMDYSLSVTDGGVKVEAYKR